MRGQLPVGLRRAEGPGVVDQPQAVRVGLPDPALPGDHGLPPDQAAVLVLLPGQGEGVAGVQHLYKQQGQRSRHQKQKKKSIPPHSNLLLLLLYRWEVQDLPPERAPQVLRDPGGGQLGRVERPEGDLVHRQGLLWLPGVPVHGRMMMLTHNLANTSWCC